MLITFTDFALRYPSEAFRRNLDAESAVRADQSYPLWMQMIADANSSLLECCSAARDIPRMLISQVSWPLNVIVEGALIEQSKLRCEPDLLLIFRALMYIQGPKSVELIYSLLQEAESSNPSRRVRYLHNIAHECKYEWAFAP